MLLEDTLLPIECKGKEFIRRQDLTAERRLHIAFRALYGRWGVISLLAREFRISRTFIYVMMNELLEVSEKVFGKCRTLWKESVKSRATVCILCLRLEGRCSIISISQILPSTLSLGEEEGKSSHIDSALPSQAVQVLHARCKWDRFDRSRGAASGRKERLHDSLRGRAGIP